jgi:hypothetical protein
VVHGALQAEDAKASSCVNARRRATAVQAVRACLNGQAVGGRRGGIEARQMGPKPAPTSAVRERALDPSTRPGRRQLAPQPARQRAQRRHGAAANRCGGSARGSTKRSACGQRYGLMQDEDRLALGRDVSHRVQHRRVVAAAE